MVVDRGMIKSAQINQLPQGIHYITAITKPQIDKLIDGGIIQMGLFHDRYRDLTQVEKAFRTCKTSMLEIRPVFVRTEKSTRGHVLVVMLAYLIVRYLQKAWSQFDVTVEEGLGQLSTLSSIEMTVRNKGQCLKIPDPRQDSRQLLEALKIRMPKALPRTRGNVDTRKKLPERRK